MTKDKRLLLAAEKIQRIIHSLKEVIAALSCEEKERLSKRLKEKTRL